MKALKLFSFLLSLGWPRGYLLFLPLAAHCHQGHFYVQLQNTDQRQGWQHRADWPGCDDISVSFSWTTSTFAFYHAPNILRILFESLPHHHLPHLPQTTFRWYFSTRVKDMHLKAMNSSLMKQYVNIWKIARRTKLIKPTCSQYIRHSDITFHILYVDSVAGAFPNVSNELGLQL